MGLGTGWAPRGEAVEHGAFFAPTLLRCADPHANATVHDVEAFGPVSTLMPYDEVDEAVALAARGRGSLVATLVTREPATAARVVPAVAAWHGRSLVLDREAAGESTGHASAVQTPTSPARASTGRGGGEGRGGAETGEGGPRGMKR